MPHREALAAAARQWDLDEALVYSIIRQESRFMPEARSRVGATGLMQLMPATARWVARQIPVPAFQPDDARAARDQHPHGHVLLPPRARRPRPPDPRDRGLQRRARAARAAGATSAPLEGAIYAETIPFNETRDYVKKVFANAWFYRHRLDGKAASLRAAARHGAGRARRARRGAVASNIP